MLRGRKRGGRRRYSRTNGGPMQRAFNNRGTCGSGSDASEASAGATPFCLFGGIKHGKGDDEKWYDFYSPMEASIDAKPHRRLFSSRQDRRTITSLPFASPVNEESDDYTGRQLPGEEGNTSLVGAVCHQSQTLPPGLRNVRTSSAAPETFPRNTSLKTLPSNNVRQGPSLQSPPVARRVATNRIRHIHRHHHHDRHLRNTNSNTTNDNTTNNNYITTINNNNRSSFPLQMRQFCHHPSFPSHPTMNRLLPDIPPYQTVGHPSLRIYRVCLPPHLLHLLDLIVYGCEGHAATLEKGWRTDLYSLTRQDIALRDIPDTYLHSKPIVDFVKKYMTILSGAVEITMDRNQPHVLKYSAADGHFGVELHHDKCDITANLCLSRTSSYVGGGTYFPLAKQVVRLNFGEFVIHPGGLVHGGMNISSGTRHLFVMFGHFKTP